MPLSTFTGGGYLPAVMLGLGLELGLGLGLGFRLLREPSSLECRLGRRLGGQRG